MLRASSPVTCGPKRAAPRWLSTTIASARLVAAPSQTMPRAVAPSPGPHPPAPPLPQAGEGETPCAPLAHKWARGGG